MLSQFKKFAAGVILATCVMSTAIVPSTEFTSVSVMAEETSQTKAVTNTKVILYSSKSTKAAQVVTLKKGRSVSLLTTGTKWVKVQAGSHTGYASGSYFTTAYGNGTNLYANALSGKTTAKISIHENKGASSKVLTTVSKNTGISVLTVGTKWSKVKVGNIIGYAEGAKISLSTGGTASEPYTKGQQLTALAKKYLGNPYVWGGSSLTNGTDCSGFVMSLYKKYGYNLPHSSYALRSVGRAVSGLKNAKAGDIICYSGHVAIYLGNNRIIHASNPKEGIKITNNASYKKIVAIRRIFK